MSELGASPGQTVGPFFHFALAFPGSSELVPLNADGSLLLYGSVLDGDGVGIPDALIEIRHADPSGGMASVEGTIGRRDAHFTGWGRTCTNASGGYQFNTLEPGAVNGGAAFIAVVVFARGLLNRLFTRIYLPGQDAALAKDPLLITLNPQERAAMVAGCDEGGNLRFDIHLQGPHESVFLSFPEHR